LRPAPASDELHESALGVEERFWRIRLKPGKPVWFGTRDQRLVFGLPGNPVSAMVTFTLLARPAVRVLQGESEPGRRGRGVLGAPLRRDPQRPLPAWWGAEQDAARDAGRWVRLVERRAQARDHPVSLGVPETRYLKCLILEVE